MEHSSKLVHLCSFESSVWAQIASQRISQPHCTPMSSIPYQLATTNVPRGCASPLVVEIILHKIQFLNRLHQIPHSKTISGLLDTATCLHSDICPAASICSDIFIALIDWSELEQKLTLVNITTRNPFSETVLSSMLVSSLRTFPWWMRSCCEHGKDSLPWDSSICFFTAVTCKTAHRT